MIEGVMEKNELQKKWKGRYEFGVDRYNSFAFDRYFSVKDIKTGDLVDTSALRYSDDEFDFCVAIDIFLDRLVAEDRERKLRDLGI
jgi:hypothetical protein